MNWDFDIFLGFPNRSREGVSGIFFFFLQLFLPVRQFVCFALQIWFRCCKLYFRKTICNINQNFISELSPWSRDVAFAAHTCLFNCHWHSLVMFCLPLLNKPPMGNLSLLLLRRIRAASVIFGDLIIHAWISRSDEGPLLSFQSNAASCEYRTNLVIPRCHWPVTSQDVSISSCWAWHSAVP